MYASNVVPLRYKVLREADGIGDLNPDAFPPIVSSCFGWLLYGAATKDEWIFWSSFPGLLIGVFLCLEASALCESPTAKYRLIFALEFWVFFWMLVSWAAIFIISPGFMHTFLGICATVGLVVMYAAPLSTLKKVLVTWDSSSLYWPSCLMAVVCSSLWAAYGLAIGDAFVWVPNAAGLLLSSVQLGIATLVPRLNESAPKLVSETSLTSKLVSMEMGAFEPLSEC